MGGFGFECIVANGTRLLGMSYTNHKDDSQADSAHVVMLVQSNPSPMYLSDIRWEFVSAWNRKIEYPQDFSPLVCNVDESTGVFSMMSYFGLTDPNFNTTDPKPPGGFQYDPRNDTWSNFGIHSDYRWTDHSSSFALFQWPGTSTLYQANIGDNNTVNLGKLKQNEFVNVGSWMLDTATYGYPTKLVYGNNSIYQFGTQVGNNRTGALKYTLTRIPLEGDPASIDPNNLDLRFYNAPALSNCTTGYLSSSYYKDTLYSFCQGIDTDLATGDGIVTTFNKGDANDTKMSDAYSIGISRISGAIIQPFDFYYNRWAFAVNTPDDFTMQTISLDPLNIGYTEGVLNQIEVPGSYGYPSGGNSKTGAIVGGVVGGLALIGIIVFVIFARRRWPEWRKKIGEKILNMTSDNDEIYRNINPFQVDKENNDKIEEPPKDDTEISGKILVTDDMELDDINIDTAYMQGVGFERHPIPGIVTSMTHNQNSFHSDGNEGTAYLEEMGSSSETLHNPSTTNANSLQSPWERGTHVPSAPQLYNPPLDESSAEISLSQLVAQKPQHLDTNSDIENSKKFMVDSSVQEFPDDIAPRYYQHYDSILLDRPNFPIPPAPTAPTAPVLYFEDTSSSVIDNDTDTPVSNHVYGSSDELNQTDDVEEDEEDEEEEKLKRNNT